MDRSTDRRIKLRDLQVFQVAAETGARFSGTLYVDSLTAADGDAPTYLDMLTFNVQAVANAYSTGSKP